ncbi:MAG: dTMP kinase [Xanthomonadaceae bacterium]|nr:dTMP kinase [Xanthomonadaceae bacterium]
MTGLKAYPRFVSIEGGEGAGKTTVLNALRAALKAGGYDVVSTREPGGTPLAEQIRLLLLRNGGGRDPEGSDELLLPDTELLLMFAARVQHVRHTIVPALERGSWVISDRFTDSSYAYQGGGRALSQALIAELEQRVVRVRPGLTLLLDIGVDQGRLRARNRGAEPDRIESEADGFFERVRATFLQRAAAEPGRIKVIDASRAADVVAADAVAILASWRDANP